MKFEQEIELAKNAAQQAAEVLRHHFKQGIQGKIKTSSAGDQGLVTQADLDSERIITQLIQESFPDHSILAEEEHQTTSESEHLWVIDPLDGTNNFAHGIPHFAVSIAYCHHGDPICGVILDPIRNDLFEVVKGQGSRHNQSPVCVNEHSALSKTMVGVGFYYDRGEMMLDTLSAIEKCFRQNVQGIRRFGTAALDLVHVGLGCFGGYFEYTLSPWDFAVGKLFVEEAGGTVTDCFGQPRTLEAGSILASNGLIHNDLLEITSCAKSKS